MACTAARPVSTRLEPVHLEGVQPLVPHRHLSVLLAGPGPSGSADPSRRCQGCSRPPPRLQDQAALSFAACCDRPEAEPFHLRPVMAPRGAPSGREDEFAVGPQISAGEADGRRFLRTPPGDMASRRVGRILARCPRTRRRPADAPCPGSPSSRSRLLWSGCLARSPEPYRLWSGGPCDPPAPCRSP